MPEASGSCTRSGVPKCGAVWSSRGRVRALIGLRNFVPKDEHSTTRERKCMRIVIATKWKDEQASTFRHGDVGQETCEETMQLLIMLITREGSRHLHLHAPVPNSGRKRMHAICLLMETVQCACTHNLSWHSCRIVPRTVRNVSIFVPAESASEHRRCKKGV